MNSTEFLRIIGFDVDHNEVVEVEAPRAKKRRLDHLSWDEKIQRKKLKNRVAAQTSRDRKKARIEQMENTITELWTRNDTLLTECENLKTLNEKLSQENAELKARLTEPCLSCKQNRSAGGESDEGSSDEVGPTSSSGFAEGGADIPEGGAGVPSLPDLLDELDRDVDFESLEQLAESLLEDIARDLENAAQEADSQVPNYVESGRQGSPRSVVGQTPEKLESARDNMLTHKEKSLENDISQYLLLHHNYTKPGPDPKESTKPKSKSKKEPKPVARTSNKLKRIVPKIPLNVLNTVAVQDETLQTQPVKCEPMLECPPIVNLEQNADSPDIIYGTYDEATNCVTIVINEDGTIANGCDEIVLTPENTVSSNLGNSLDLPFSKIVNGGVSPMSCSGSDCGYESLGSPTHGENDWIEMSELFPSLL